MYRSSANAEPISVSGEVRTSESHEQVGTHLLCGLRRVIPIFIKKRPDLCLDFAAKPGVPIDDGLVQIRGDVAVADPKLGSERSRRRNRRIQRLNAHTDLD